MKKFFKLLSTFLLLGGVTFATTNLASCNEAETDDFIDYVNTSEVARLRLDYKNESGANRDFFTDGISEVTLYTAIDGDTAHFKMKGSGLSSETIKIRFYGIDTPESTGSIEPWGYEAKVFTRDKLEAAKTIVITSTSLDAYVKPSTDSTGSRYLGMVWISDKENASYDELVLLNLWIVQEGYSYVRNLNSFPEFVEVFNSAEQQARNKKLHLFSGEEAPGYNYGDYEATDLLAISQAIRAQLEAGSDENEFTNAKVRVQGTVAGYANNMLYLQTRFEVEDETTGDTVEVKYAGINVFTGMGSIRETYTTINTMIELSATCSNDENFGFQLSGVYNFPAIPTDDPNDTVVIYKPSEIPDEYKVHTFEMKASELGEANYDVMFSPVTVTEELTVTGGYTSVDNEVTLYTQDSSGNRVDFGVYVPFLYTPDENNKLDQWNQIEDYEGHTIRVTGIYSWYKSRSGNIIWQVIPRDSSDIILVK